jgi:uncharacterized SAM-binding protein YcdF (DUF218 family)
MRLKAKSSIKSFLFTMSLFLNLFFLVVLTTPLTEILHKPLIHDEPVSSKCEAIVILSAGIYKSGLPDFRTMVRLRKGYELYQQSRAEKIICIGGIRADSPSKSIAVIMKDTLVAYGIPSQQILIEDETINTYNDISYMLYKFRSDFDFDKTVFVTSSYHTYRVKRILEKKGINAKVVSAEPYELYPHKIVERAELFSEVIREYMAIYYSWMKGWI